MPEFAAKFTPVATGLPATKILVKTGKEKAAINAAEGVAAKVSVAQAEIQFRKDIKPYINQANKANTLAIAAVILSAAAVIISFL